MQLDLLGHIPSIPSRGPAIIRVLLYLVGGARCFVGGTRYFVGEAKNPL